MAAFGANHPCFKADSQAKGVVLGKLVSANLTVNLTTGELYADDTLAEQISEFASGTLPMETDDLSDDVAGIIYGAEVDEGEVTYNKGDTAPYGCLSYYKAIMKDGVKSYKGYYYPRVRAALGNDNAQTRGSSITFQTTTTTFTIFTNDAGDWRITEVFTTPAEAVKWCEEKCKIGA